MKKFLIHTMGCKSNQFESSVIKENLISEGYEEVLDVGSADFYILNSCTVTHKSDNEAMYLLRNSKRKNPNIVNIITGCVAQIEKEKLLKNSFIDIVIGNDEKFKIPEIIKSNKKILVTDIMECSQFTYTQLNDTTKTRASLKIQDGCDNRCSYCIIPYARGNNRSANAEFIVEQVNNLVDKGFKEVVFTGIHIGLWGKEYNKKLLDLLINIEEKTLIKRFRLGSLYPNEIDDDMLDFLSTSEKFCPHFHLSLQSACNKTLKSMNRYYSVEEYLQLIDKINEIFDLPFIGSDIIAGFAGETDNDFKITCNNLKKSVLSQIHTFPYSIRKDTVGANMPNQIDDLTKEQRANIIKEISKQKYLEFINRNIDTTQEVLVEKHPDKHTGLLKGVTRNFLTVTLNSKDLKLCNTIQKVKIKEFLNNKLYGDFI